MPNMSHICNDMILKFYRQSGNRHSYEDNILFEQDHCIPTLSKIRIIFHILGEILNAILIRDL